MKSCAIYCRFSSEQQRDSMSIEAQKRACLDFAEKNGLKVFRIYVDKAKSGTSDDREGFKEMISDALSKDKPFDSVLVHKLDRFARNRYDSIQYKHILRKKGIRVLSVSQPIIGSGDPTEVILESVLEGMDEFYSLNLARESLKGMAENARRGWANGGFAPYGYVFEEIKTDKGAKRKYKINESEAKTVRLIYEMYLAGDGVQGIRYKLNLKKMTMRGRPWTKNTITNILKNEKYAGDIVFGKNLNRANRVFDMNFEAVKVKNAHEAIIDRETWNRVQNILQKKAPSGSHPRSAGSDYLFSGMMKCSFCGSHFIGAAAHGRKERYRYYVCGKISREGPGACRQMKLNADAFEDLVIWKLKEHLTRKEYLEKIIRAHNESLRAMIQKSGSSLKRLEKEIRDLDDKRRRLFEAIESGSGLSAEDIAPRIREISSLKAEKEADLDSIRAQAAVKPIRDSAAVLEAWTRFYKDLFGNDAFWKNKAMIQSFIISIEIEERFAVVSYNADIWPRIDRIPLGPEGPGEDPGGGREDPPPGDGGKKPDKRRNRFEYRQGRGAIIALPEPPDSLRAVGLGVMRIDLKDLRRQRGRLSASGPRTIEEPGT